MDVETTQHDANPRTTQSQVCKGSRPPGPEQRLKELGIQLPAPPDPFGMYAEAVQTGNLLFLSGVLPTEGRAVKFIGRVHAEFEIETARNAARLAALNCLAVAREYLGSLDKVTRIVRLGVSVATSGDVRDHPKVADRAFPVIARRLRKRQEPQPLGIGRCESPAGRSCRSGNHFRSAAVSSHNRAK